MWKLVTAICAALLLVACGGGGGGEVAREEPSQESLTVEQAYARVAEAMTRTGQVYHTVIEGEAKVGEMSHSSASEYWVDAGRDLARVGDTEVIVGGVRYTGGSPIAAERPSNKSPAHRCHGANFVVSALLQCQGENELSSAVEVGQYQDNSAIVLVSDIEISGEDETSKYTQRLYLDRSTFLPLAFEDKGTLESDKVEQLQAQGRYRSDFVSGDSLAQGFFEPASIGYVEKDPLEPLNRPDLGVTVYWLGESFAPGGGLPDLKVAGVEIPSCGPFDASKPTPPGFICGPGYKFILNYRLASDDFGPPVLTIQEWTAADWDAQHVQGDFSRVRIFRFPVTLAFVAAPSMLCGGRPQVCTDSPYDNAAALEVVGAALKPRQ